METRACPTCATELPIRFRLCGECGEKQGGARETDEIRRFATVVQSDLKGSTALGEKLDPETLRELLGLYFDEMRAVFESHGGTIEKIIGDAIIAVFGLPVLHDDDALRAVEAAAESQRVLARLNDRLDATWGIRLVVRTGVGTGDVVFGEASAGQRVLTGDTMTISSAMEQNAPPLEVLISEPTYLLVRDHVEVEPVGPVSPKGSALSVPAYRLVSVVERPMAEAEAPVAVSPGMRACPACGEENPEGFRLCGMCGANMAVSTTFRESRKTVTIVFADPKPTAIDGTTPSPEAIRDVMTRYFDAMRVALERHGGTVEKFIGDAVMAVYGLPVRHEDDAVRAIRSAWEMQAALPALNEEFRRDWGLELRNHIGVNTGEVIAGDASLGQRLVTGDAVNTAARLEQAAGPAEIILGDLTYRLARDQIKVEPIPPLTLKGKAEPVPAYRLVHVGTRPSERVAKATQFVGREAELARLRDALRDAERHRACRLSVVIGDAGVGKSRLVRELASSVSSQAEVVRGRCLPYGDGITFWPIGEIVRAVAQIDDHDSTDVALARIAGLAFELDNARDAAAVAERVASAIGLSSTVFQKDELFWGIRILFESMARQRPLVVIIDDIHVAAPTFLELFDHFLDAVRDAPIVLLGTARHELRETHADWATRHDPSQIILEPLGDDQANAILDQLLIGLDPVVRARIAESAEGNPLYVEQIASMLIETGALRQDDGRWVPTSDSGEVAIPPTVQALVAARLDALPPNERSAIDPASVIGYSFPGEALVRLVEEEVRADVTAHLRSLSTKQLVRPTAVDGEFYRFGHSVIKDTAYGSLLKRVRAVIHEKFVDWAEPVNRERGREIEFEEILGYHLEQAYRYRAELGPVGDHARELAGRAADKLGGAGRRAFSRSDFPSAAALLLRASALLDESDPARIGMLVQAAEALQELSEFDRAGQVLEAAEEAARSLGDARLEAHVLLGRLMKQFDTGDPPLDLPRDTEKVERLLATFEEAGDEGGLARGWRMLTVLKMLAGRVEEATLAARRWVEHGRASGEEWLARSGVRNHATLALLGPAPVEEVLPFCEQMLGQVGGSRRSEAALSGTLSVLHAMQGSFERARELYTRAKEVLDELGPSQLANMTATESGPVELLAGNPAGAERELRRDYDALGEMGEKAIRPPIGALLAEAVYQQGRPEEAAELTRVVRDLAADHDVFTQTVWRRVAAKAAAHRGDVQTATRLADEALALAREADLPQALADVLVDVGEVHVLCDRHESAGPPWREALELFERKGDRVSAARARARLSRLSA